MCMKIKDISGAEHTIDCIACAIQTGQVTLPIERIAETEHFVAEQDFEYPIEGFVIVASKRHIRSITELSEGESTNLMQFLISCRKAMREQLGISEITIVQEEHSSSSHFHIWLFPWLSWMDEHGYRRKVTDIAAVMKEAKGAPRTPEQGQRLALVAEKLKRALVA